MLACNNDNCLGQASQRVTHPQWEGIGVRRDVGLHHPTTDLRSTSIIAGRVFWNDSLVSKASV